MAEKLAMPWSTYMRYETRARYKKALLPLDLTRRIAAVLADHGVDPAEVMALAGVGLDEVPAPELSAGEEQLLDDFRELTPEQQAVLRELVNTMRAARPSDTPQAQSASVTVGSGSKSFRREPVEQP